MTGSEKENGRLIRRMYRSLFDAYGSQGWWPGDEVVEIAVGAMLTQNTNWRNAERAIDNLRRAGLLDWAALRDVRVDRLAHLIRPSGYFRIKARRIKNLVTWLWRCHDGDFARLRRRPLPALREELLAIHGIGPETADSILLYALDRPTFVIDAYTARLARRHGLARSTDGYDDLKQRFEGALESEACLFNEYHALIVRVGKSHCGKRAKCAGCPLESFEHDDTQP